MPDREVVVMMGDGGFQMTMQELGTIMQNKIGVKMIVLNNHYLGMVRQWQQLFFSVIRTRASKAEVHDDCRGVRDSEPSRDAVVGTERGDRRTGEGSGAYFLEVDVLSEENVFPMVPAGASLSDLIAKEPDKK